MLTRQTLKSISPDAGIVIPEDSIFSLPEKVLQFGTGVLLRGLPDYFIDKANRNGIFNGRVVVVKSTDSGDSSAFEKQDGLYTICVRGIDNGNKVEENIINSSISRVVSAKTEWHKILQCAHDPNMQVIISNTTEVGITFVEDDINAAPPVSFPGKLLSFLYERYKAFNGSKESGMVIVPTELITENGKKLEAIVIQLAELNKLDAPFTGWLKNSNYFCNSLVDRIVPGAPGADQRSAIQAQLGYTDDLMILSEVYRLWAIESASQKVKDVLSFYQADEGVAIAPDITKFRELKLRLLNGTHTLSCGLAILAGYPTVKEAMEEEEIPAYMHQVMTQNIIPVLVNKQVTEQEAVQFAGKVLDRFRNPYIEHKWVSISVQYTSKMKMRNLPVLEKLTERHITPELFALGFAAYLLFMKSEKGEDGSYRGKVNGADFVIQDEKAAYFYKKWQENKADDLVMSVLSDASLWGTDLTTPNGFADLVKQQIALLADDGAKAAISQFITKTVK